MPGSTKITDVKLTSAKEAKGARKIKFAEKSFKAFKAAKERVYGLAAKRLEDKYKEQLSELETVIKDAQQNKVVRPDVAITAQVDKLMSIGVRLAKLDLDFKRLEQQTGPKPIKLGKGFIENIKQKFKAGVFDNEKEKLVSTVYNNYRVAREELSNAIKQNETPTIEGFKNPLEFAKEVEKQPEPVRTSNASSLFANMQTNAAGFQASAHEPEVGETNKRSYNLNFDVKKDESTQVFSTPEPPSYDDFLKGMGQPSYFGGVQHVFELPPAGKDRNIGTTVPGVSTAFGPFTSNEPVVGKNDNSNSVGTETPNFAREDKENQKLQPNISDESNVQEIQTTEPDYSSYSNEQLLELAKKLTGMVEEREAEKTVEAKAIEARESAERVAQFHRNDDFYYDSRGYAEIVQKEQAAQELREQQWKENEVKFKKEAMDSLLNGELSFEKIKAYISMGAISSADLAAKMQDKTLGVQQTMHLYGAAGIIAKMEAEALERQNAKSAETQNYESLNRHM